MKVPTTMVHPVFHGKSIAHGLKHLHIIWPVSEAKAVFHSNIDFQNLVHDFDEELIFHETLKLEAWADTQEQVDFAAKCCGGFANEIHGPGDHILILYVGAVGQHVPVKTKLPDIFRNKSPRSPAGESHPLGTGPNC